MQVAAFWKGDIVKQVTVADFFRAGEGSLIDKLNTKEKDRFNIIRNKLKDSNDWQNFMKESLSQSLSKHTYHTNYYKVRNQLTNLMGNIEDEDEVGSLEEIKDLLEDHPPLEGRLRRRKNITIDIDPKNLSIFDKIIFIGLVLPEFKKEVSKEESTPSGFAIYGKDTHKHLKSLFEVKLILQDIYDGLNFPGIPKREQEIVNDVKAMLDSEVEILNPDAGRTKVEKIKLSLWDALHKVGAIYGFYGVSDRQKRKRIMAKTRKLGQRNIQDRETLEWLSEFTGDRVTQETMDLFHSYADYELIAEEMNELVGKDLEDNPKLQEKRKELEAEKESIELDIINDFGEEVLEEFKSKLYSRTAEQIGESLGERPGVQIREE